MRAIHDQSVPPTSRREVMMAVVELPACLTVMSCTLYRTRPGGARGCSYEYAYGGGSPCPRVSVKGIVDFREISLLKYPGAAVTYYGTRAVLRAMPKERFDRRPSTAVALIVAALEAGKTREAHQCPCTGRQICSDSKIFHENFLKWRDSRLPISRGFPRKARRRCSECSRLLRSRTGQESSSATTVESGSVQREISAFNCLMKRAT